MAEDLERQIRWEFLRRNPRYQKDYADLLKKLEGKPQIFESRFRKIWLALYMKSLPQVEKEFPQDDVPKVRERFILLARFKEKWALAFPEDPAQAKAPHFFSTASAQAPVEILFGDKLPPAADPENALYCRIDLRRDPEEILAHLKDMLAVSEQLRVKDEMSDLPDPKWSRYHHYLFLYDQVILNGSSLESAAAQIFPELETGDSEERQHALAKAQQYLDESKRLVAMAEAPE